MGDKYTHTHTHTHTHMLTDTGLAALSAADMKMKGTTVWTCTLVVSLLLESCHTHKLNVHWGPQSMMYLKGKHGRRFVSEDSGGVLKQGLQGWYAVLKGIQRLQLLEFSKPTHIVSSENVLIHYLQQR